MNGLSEGQITVAQLAPGTKDIILWEFTKCYDHCVLLRRPQGKLSDPEIFVDMRWTLDNSLILLNDRCELFKVRILQVHRSSAYLREEFVSEDFGLRN